MSTVAPASAIGAGSSPSELRRRTEVGRNVASGGAVVGLVLLGLQQEVTDGVTIGLLYVLATSFAWLPALKTHRGARALIVVGLVAVASGLVLAGQAGGRKILPSTALDTAALVVLILAGTGFVLWCRKWLHPGAIGVALGFGMLLSVNTASPRFLDDPWRFGWSIPLTITVLGLASISGRRMLQIGAVLLFAFIATFTDARSTFAMLLLTAIALGWQYRPRPKNRAASAAILVAFGSFLAVGVYQLGQALLVNGALGAAAQARSLQQIEETGSLLLGGRPELAATAALFVSRPTGMGLGVQPALSDVHTAQQGMAVIGYDGDNGYVWNYMFGTGFELHSTAADLWASLGFAGILLVLVLAFAVVRGTALAIAGNSASALLLFVAIKSMWNLGFGPLDTSALPLLLALGLALPVLGLRTPRSSRRGSRRRAAVAR